MRVLSMVSVYYNLFVTSYFAYL